MSQQINLYSPLFRKQKKVFSALALAQAIGLVVVAVAVLYVYFALQSSLLEIRAAESERTLKSELERLKLYGVRESPGEKAKTLAERRKQLEGALAERARAVQVMEQGGLGRAEGYSGVLRALARLSREGVWLTAIRFSEQGSEVAIAGRATRPELVAAYLERLRAEPALRGQAFSTLEIRRAPRFVEFVLSSGEGEEDEVPGKDRDRP